MSESGDRHESPRAGRSLIRGALVGGVESLLEKRQQSNGVIVLELVAPIKLHYQRTRDHTG
jgi:hypothetical protein